MARSRRKQRARSGARARKRNDARTHAHLQGAVAGERSSQDAESASAESAEATGAPKESPATVIAAVLATPCANTEITPQPENLALARTAILCLINRRRAEDGEQPLIANADLEAAAESHAAECVADDYFAHVSPSGETPVDRIRGTGYLPSPEAGYVLGENLAWGTFELSTPQAIAQAWFASPPHLANILESQYRETGIGVAPAVPSSLGDGNPGATYAQEFGVVLQ